MIVKGEGESNVDAVRNAIPEGKDDVKFSRNATFGELQAGREVKVPITEAEAAEKAKQAAEMRRKAEEMAKNHKFAPPTFFG